MKRIVQRRRIALSLATILAVFVATLLSAAPAQAAYSPPQYVSVQASGYGLNVGALSGTAQFDDSRTKFRYDMTFCRNSSFVAPTLEIKVNDIFWKNVYHSGGGPVLPGCKFAYQLSVEEEYGSPVRSVQFVVIGSTFNQNVYKTHRSTNGNSYGKVLNPYF